MADSNKHNNKPYHKFEARFVEGGRYDLSNLPKTKSGKRRRSFRRREVPKQFEDPRASNAVAEDESELDILMYI